jgi:hypothetical protein
MTIQNTIANILLMMMTIISLLGLIISKEKVAYGILFSACMFSWGWILK